MIVYFGVFNIAAFPAFFVLGPYVAKHSLGGPKAWALILIGGSMGAVLGGLLAIRSRPKRPVFAGTLATTLIASALLTLGSTLVVLAVPSVRNLRTDDLVVRPAPAA